MNTVLNKLIEIFLNHYLCEPKGFINERIFYSQLETEYIVNLITQKLTENGILKTSKS